MDVGNLGRSYLTTRLQGRDNKQDNMALVRHLTTTLSNTGEAHYNSFSLSGHVTYLTLV